MKVEIRSNGTVVISGYVNAVERDSRVLPRRMCPDAQGDFVERVKAGTFTKALSRGHPIEARFNHGRRVGGTDDGTLELREDNIGLHATLKTSDPEVAGHARRKELRGWSFGFVKIADEWETAGENLQRRTLEDIDLGEVSVLTECPAYIGTSVELRGENTTTRETRGAEDDAQEVVTAADESAKLKEIEILKMRGKKNESESNV